MYVGMSKNKFDHSLSTAIEDVRIMGRKPDTDDVNSVVTNLKKETIYDLLIILTGNFHLAR
jgi:hypothetical protein